MTHTTASTAETAVDHLLGHCGSLTGGERVLIVCDPQTRAVARLLDTGAARLTRDHLLVEVAPFTMHGQEPPDDVAAQMAAADLVLGVTWFSMAHTKARRIACERGARYLSMPEYSMALLADPCVLADFRGNAPRVRDLTAAFTAGSTAVVRTALGTDVTIDISRRTGNCCPGFVAGPGELGSPPDAEANVSPIETGSNGVIVIDGSIPCPTIGLLPPGETVTLHVRDGSITSWTGPASVTDELDRLFASCGSPKARVLAELGVGLNEHARLTGVMLTDEGAAGTLHFGFGSNATVGGQNDVPFHLDFVLRDPDLHVDGRAHLLVGVYQD